MRNLGEEFDRATRKGGLGFFEENIRSALIALRINLVETTEADSADFNPQYKMNKDEKRRSSTIARNNRNYELWSDGKKLKQIKFLSIERNGISHDFPIRFEKNTAGLSRLFNGKNTPIIVVTGLDGKERSFRVPDERSNLRSTRKIAAFMTEELAKKNRPTAQLLRPS